MSRHVITLVADANFDVFIAHLAAAHIVVSASFPELGVLAVEAEVSQLEHLSDHPAVLSVAPEQMFHTQMSEDS